MDCKEVGWAVQRLGAGRNKPGGPVSAHAGIESHAKLGQRVEAGDLLFTLFSETEAAIEEPFQMLERTIQLSELKPDLKSFVQEIVLQR